MSPLQPFAAQVQSPLPMTQTAANGDGLDGRPRGFLTVMRSLLFSCTRPFGYLAFVLALTALSAAAKLLGEEHELGFFAGRLNETILGYPEVTRRGVRMAWLSWLLLLGLALSPLDPIASRWDEVLLGAVALGVLSRRTVGAGRAGR
jgi:hypothetical protein